jgi:hypothetical protein
MTTSTYARAAAALALLSVLNACADAIETSASEPMALVNPGGT